MFFGASLVQMIEDGWVNAFDVNSKMPFTKIQGFFKRTNTGYNLELRFPLSMLGNKLGFAIADVDSKQPNQTPSIVTKDLSKQRSYDLSILQLFV